MEIKLTLSPAAIAHLKAQLQAHNQAKFIRFRRQGLRGGCNGFQYCVEATNDGKPTDILLNFDGLMVRVDRRSAPLLDGTAVDMSKSLLNKELTFSNPNHKNVCGCGKSFSI